MPIEIRELVIKATISEDTGKKGSEKSPPTADRGEIIADCVEQVMELLASAAAAVIRHGPVTRIYLESGRCRPAPGSILPRYPHCITVLGALPP